MTHFPDILASGGVNFFFCRLPVLPVSDLRVGASPHHFRRKGKKKRKKGKGTACPKCAGPPRTDPIRRKGGGRSKSDSISSESHHAGKEKGEKKGRVTAE